VLFARTVGLGELLVIVVIVLVVVVGGLIAFRGRTSEDG
jgi:Sec-independent protein translocase protein TatA